MSQSRHLVNSPAWWDEYFIESWEALGGRTQTRHFMERILAELLAPESEFLRSRPLDILDWGCALGEGVEVLAQALPASRVSGLDVSTAAVGEARRRHPRRDFILSDGGNIGRPFDVVVVSNCLEHFERPLEIAEAHLRWCRELYIALVPFDESPLSEAHRVRLVESSFPPRLGQFTRLYARRIDVDPACWPGQQLLVAYASAAYRRDREGGGRAREEEKWDAYYTGLPLVESDRETHAFGLELAERVGELLPQGGRVLEAGAGAGWQSLALARTGKFEVTLLDFSGAALDYARRVFAREGQTAEFVRGDVFAPGEARFDLVFNAGVLEHYTMAEQASFLRGMASRSRDLVLALVPNQSCYWYWVWRALQASRGEWPFGKETPLVDFSGAFAEAELQFLGQTYLGESWTEGFLVNLSGLDRELCDVVLDVHRGPLLPAAQKAYLLAALGCVSRTTRTVPRAWSAPLASQSMEHAEVTAALGDALALNIRARNEARHLQAQITEHARVIEELASERGARQQAAELADREQALRHERDAAFSHLSIELGEARQQLQRLAGELAEHERAAEVEGARAREQARTLGAQLAESQGERQSLTARLADREAAVEGLATRLASQEEGSRRLAGSLSGQTHRARVLSEQTAEGEQIIQTLSASLARKDEQAQLLAAQLRDTMTEIGWMTQTRGWRWLRRYWSIRDRCLVSVYRRLGLARLKWGGVGTTAAAPPPSGPLATARPSVVQAPPGSGGAQSPAVAPVPRADSEPERAAFGVGGDGVTARRPAAHDVLCLPIIEWDFRFQRPQQLMTQFAVAGHRVFYVAQTFRAAGPAYVIAEKAENILEVSLRGPALNAYTDALDEETGDAWLASLDALRRDQGLGATAVIVQLPFWWPLARRVRERFGWPVVYDLMDDHVGFSTNRPGMLEAEGSLLGSADLVVASSAVLAADARTHRADVLTIRNACDFDHFAVPTAPASARPIIGYYGAIADWFDADLVADLAEKRPDWDFVLIGSTFMADTRRLAALGNVSLVGEKPYGEIPARLATFDVAIIPFRRTRLTEATNPVKAYEMLAAGKPIVSVPIPEMQALWPLVRMASTVEEFHGEIRAALTERDPELAARRRAFASEHTWRKRFEALAPAVRASFPKASIIVVTFNNLELNRLCLESVYARTEWPNFEVIVVDNASADGTPAYLRQVESVWPGLRVILNDRNLGFAAGNNAGVRLATGEWLVLLNNDTVVTRGWLSTLIRHLHVDPQIGMIGPVTNAIANEARVDVGYKDLAGMPEWAAAYVREHGEETFAPGMLAMFCVAMRREVFETVGPLDERFGVGMFEDDDYCRRLEVAGYRLLCARDAFIHHWQRASFRLLGEEEYLRVYHENRTKYEDKWKALASAPSGNGERWHEPLREVIERARNTRGAIIMLPSIAWNIHLFQRPHHLARAFAAQGFVCIFDCSSTEDDGVDGFKEIETNLFLFHGPQSVLAQIPDPILWAFTYNFHLKSAYPASARTVYDWIDALEVFPFDRTMLERSHARGLREATAVVAVTRDLQRSAAAVRPDAMYLPNGVEYDRFADADASCPDDAELAGLLAQGKPVAGYYGALARWFDYRLLDEVAQRRPDWNFVLIGPSHDDSLGGQAVLLGRANVTWLGARRYEELPGYLRSFDVAMIPFVINTITLATSPLKLYEYMAAGKPVIATPIPECASFAEVHIAGDADAFAAVLDRACAEGRDGRRRAALQAIARENSWASRAHTVIERFESLDGGTADVGERPPSVQPGVAPTLTGAAAAVAERFGRFRTPRNREFFAALANHLASLSKDPRLPMYFEFAITCNERGAHAADLLRSHIDVTGKRALDVGCAYGGFLVAFAERGAEVVGVDVDPVLLDLARANLRDHGVDASMSVTDATRADECAQLEGRFDVITCNDVIEHVDDPGALVDNVAALLARDGLVYFEIPNRYAPRHVLSDGHYQLFGITLLDYEDARAYFAEHAPGVPYRVRHYMELDRYARWFERAGLRLDVLDETLAGASVEGVLADVEHLRRGAVEAIEGVPGALRAKVEAGLRAYLHTVETCPRETARERRAFLLRFGVGFWRVIGRTRQAAAEVAGPEPERRLDGDRWRRFVGFSFHEGRCNVCGEHTRFFYQDAALYRESLFCGGCLTSSRYRSIARGVLRAIDELGGVRAASLRALAGSRGTTMLRVYDAQVPFYLESYAYPIPDLLNACEWIEAQTSLHHPDRPLGSALDGRVTNQNLQALTFADASFDIVVTSDVMEHVRLDFRVHQEIRRILRPGGVYLFTVPHFRDRRASFYRVAVVDPADPEQDIYVAEKEYHGDVNAVDGRALSYRSYGTDLDDLLDRLGFVVEYSKADVAEAGIMNTELFYCRLRK